MLQALQPRLRVARAQREIHVAVGPDVLHASHLGRTSGIHMGLWDINGTINLHIHGMPHLFGSFWGEQGKQSTWFDFVGLNPRLC